MAFAPAYLLSVRRLPVFVLAVLFALASAAASQAAQQAQAALSASAAGQGPRQASISWQSSTAAPGSITVVGPSGLPLVVSDNSLGSSHTVSLDGLQPGAHYRFTVNASVSGKKVSSTGEFVTAPASSAPLSVSTSSGIFRVDGGGFFPVLSWAQCAADVPQGIAVGINTFMGSSCQIDELAAAVNGRAYMMNSLADGRRLPGQIGWFQPDEADGVGVPASTLAAPPGDLPTLQTLTTHFAPQLAGDLQGTGQNTDYSGYFNHADSLGFDLYPAAEFCGRNPGVGIHSVFDLQQSMVKAAAGKPTYQWIETNDLEHRCADPVSGPLARAEAWLAVAGGADAVGWFTHGWPGGAWQHFYMTAGVQQAVSQTDSELQAFAPALLAKQLPAAQPPSQPVKFGLRELDGTVYVIAVNSSDQPASGAVGIPQLEPRTKLRALLGQGDTTVNSKHAAVVHLSGYEVRVLAAVS